MPYLLVAAGAGVVGLWAGSKATNAINDVELKGNKVVQYAGIAALAYVGYGIYSGKLRVPGMGA